MRLSLHKPEKLRHNRQFKEVYMGGRRISGPHLTIFVKANRLPFNRLGLSVRKKRFKLSTERHCAQRRLREVYRGSKMDFLPGHDIIINARSLPRGKSCFTEIKKEFLSLAQKAQLVRKRC